MERGREQWKRKEGCIHPCFMYTPFFSIRTHPSFLYGHTLLFYMRYNPMAFALYTCICVPCHAGICAMHPLAHVLTVSLSVVRGCASCDCTSLAPDNSRCIITCCNVSLSYNRCAASHDACGLLILHAYADISARIGACKSHPLFYACCYYKTQSA